MQCRSDRPLAELALQIPHGHAHLYVQRFGRGDVTLLAIGGWTAPGIVWHDEFSHLDGCRCISLDHRGTGLTQAPLDGLSFRQMADDVRAVADALDLRRCVLLAESSGGAVALRAALQAPGRFAGLVLSGAGWKPVPSAAFDAAAGALRADPDRFVRGFVAACLPESRDPALRRLGCDLLKASPLAAAEALTRCRVGVDWGDELAGLDLPVLLLHGTDDRIVPVDDSRELARRLPRATLVELPGLGHAPMLTQPAQVAQHVAHHLAHHVAHHLGGP